MLGSGLLEHEIQKEKKKREEEPFLSSKCTVKEHRHVHMHRRAEEEGRG